ncbi:MAG: lysylphosphatidylglycerol synthase domain-containing protein, partial [Nitrososphaerales archaeon]
MMKWSMFLLKLSISLVILLYIHTHVSIPAIITSFTSTNVNLIIMSLGLMFLARYLLAFQMKLLTDKQQMGLSVGRIFQINLITGFYQMFLPGDLSGGAIRWYKL